MKIKKGDKVIVISGADKGKTGVVQKAHPSLNKVVVEGVNLRKKHKKPTQQNPEGSIVDIYAPIHVSNVALIDPKTKKATRVGTMVDKKGKKIRVSTAKAGRNKLD
ncbi:50S ribosomal protein L24 [Coprobacillus sp. CAG:826]|jgi:large subunit ribosomal protein L24|nr:50S ribosomal protein L24 [Coprobacillus sp.]CDD92555.1 50S ribosomal protein L24 [Coprobacillus sp. CAG:826]